MEQDGYIMIALADASANSLSSITGEAADQTTQHSPTYAGVGGDIGCPT